MPVVNFGSSRQLSIDIEAPAALHRGVGIHRLTFPIQVDTRNTIETGVPVELRGQAWLGANLSDWLGTWTTERPVVTRKDLPDSATLVLPLTDEQLAVIEQRRAGADMQIMFDIQAVLGYDPAVATGDGEARWPARTFQQMMSVQSESWTRLLRQAATGTSLAIVLPVPLGSGAEAAAVGAHLREAIRKVDLGEYADALTSARKALEATGDGVDKDPDAAKTAAKQRSLPQRLSVLRSSLHSLASLGAHHDAITADIQWDRETALAVIAGVAALAACRELPTDASQRE